MRQTAVVFAMLVATLGGLGVARRAESPPPVVPATEETSVDFVREVRPILSAHCFACHGLDAAAREADLDLTSLETASLTRDGGVRAIVPGDRESSEVWRRINDAGDPMPPEEAHNALSATQIEVLGRWIDQGAEFAPHWAYVSPRRTLVPQVGDETWPERDIDRYVLSRLESEGLVPAPDADDVTLLRRLSYDLTGLPPTPAEIDDFLSDASSTRVDEVVDRLLASPHYGERMAMLWLDLVRYADTVGYHGDQGHRVWPYRDYVIGAFNANKPFDEFTIEQLAGDLLHSPTTDQLVATAYNRLLQTSHEGGVQLKEYRAIYQADRIRNVTETWMGATVGCAQCHDHKYDPYTARDFYALGAFFADIDDEEHLRNPYGGLNTTPTKRTPEMRVPRAEHLGELAVLEAELVAARERESLAVEALERERPAWEGALLARAAESVAAEYVWVDDRLDTGGSSSGAWSFVRDDAIPPHSGERYRVQRSSGLVQHYTVDTTERRIEIGDGDKLYAWVYVSEDEPASALMLQFNVAGDWEHRAVWGSDEIAYGRRSPSWVGYQRMGPMPAAGEWFRLEVDASAVGLTPGEVVTGFAFTQFGGTVYWDDAGSVSSQTAPAAVLAALSVVESERTDAQRAVVAAHHRETSAAVRAIRDEIAALQVRRGEIESRMPLTLFTRALDEPREVRVLPRGDWLDESGEVVEPAVPHFFEPIETDGRATRLDLARWLVTPEREGGVGELTARVFVNRVWAMLFGEGLCPSVEDFGGQGLPPNHLELLDRLSLQFVESGWDVKALIRSMVHSRTYRQSSVPSPEAAEADPNNMLYARQARYRMPAEMVRDTALAVSGLLERDIGGPSIKPAQPEGYYRHLNFPPRKYRPDTDHSRLRRGVYVHWQRQYLHPMLRAFDAPSREECTARRSVSNTPLAALTLLNDPVFVEAAVAFADRLLAMDAPNDSARLRLAMREATGRVPSDGEVRVLSSVLEESLASYAASPDEAAALLAVASAGSSSVDPSVRAAWTQVSRALLNLHETITRE